MRSTHLGGSADAHDEQPRRQRVQRARVPHLELLVARAALERAAQLGHHVERRPAEPLREWVGGWVEGRFDTKKAAEVVEEGRGGVRVSATSNSNTQRAKKVCVFVLE